IIVSALFLTLLLSLSVVSEAAKLRILTNVSGGKNPEEMDLFAKELSEHLGMEVELIKPPSDYGQFVQTTLRGGERYDIIYMTKDLMDVLVSQRALMPLDDFIASSPILSDPAVIPTEEWEQVRYPDGRIYSVFNKYEGGTMPTVRADWLEKVGLDVPETLYEFYEVLNAFKERDPDGNGIVDTYGLSTAGLYDIQGFMGAFGVKARYVIDEEGKRTIPYASDAAIPAYEWLNRLYREGILDPNFVTNSTGDF